MMTEDSTASGDEGGQALPQALVREKARISVVWLIPVVAAVVGLYLAYWAWSEQGPTIEIHFENAEGLEAGKTKIKYKDVEIGVVESVALSDDISEVVVTASLVNGVAPYLTETTRFWVVRAEFTAGSVSGLSTVLSGVYIAIDPSTRGKRTKRFTGLEKAPIVTSDKPGSFFDLRSRDLGSIQIGSPVYYRWLKVGQVVGFDLDESGDFVNIKVFVERPHDARVSSTTRFWNASGVDLSVDSDGLRLDSPSIVTMLVGGIAFDTPTTLAEATPVGPDQVFQLYANRSASLTRNYVIKNRFVLDFGDTSVAGLSPGAAVLFRGIKIGEVLAVDLLLDPRTEEFSTPIVIELEPERLGLSADELDGSEIDLMRRHVARGLRARLGIGSLLTGKKVIELEFVEGAPPATLETAGAYPKLPTTADPIEALAEQVSSVLGKVDQVPLASIGANLDGALAELRETLVTFREAGATATDDVLPELTATLSELEGTLSGTNRMLAPDSPLAFELERLVTDLAAAARSLRGLAERLEEHPEELIRGKSE
jgi:paraquat-inducible protein B